MSSVQCLFHAHAVVVTVAVAGSWRREEKENGRQEKRKMLGKAALHEQNKTCSKERTREEKKIKNSRKREKEREGEREK